MRGRFYAVSFFFLSLLSLDTHTNMSFKSLERVIIKYYFFSMHISIYLISSITIPLSPSLYCI